MSKHTYGTKGTHNVATILRNLGQTIERTDGPGRHSRKQGRKTVATILNRIEHERFAEFEALAKVPTVELIETGNWVMSH